MDLPLDDLRLSVVPNPVGPEIEARKPEHARLLQLGQRQADPLARQGHVKIARTRQAEGRGKVDRLDDLSWDERTA